MSDSVAAPVPVERPRDAAPNVVLVLLDDVGFGTCSTFGGPVPTPALDKVAAAGLRFNQFHTTALCSPTRAALLTGRNHHAVHMGGTPEAGNVFPGYDSVIPREAASVAKILQLEGYSTAMFGKWHLTPTWEMNPSGPFDHWPVGQGFDKFYGILSPESSQYEPSMWSDTTPVSPHLGRDDYHMSEDITDQAINWMHMQRATNPDRPFFLYWASGALHCPHHVPAEWVEPFRGQFDEGWDELRRRIYERQLELGIIPPQTRLTTRPEQIPSWEDYPERYRPVAARLMETFAGMMAHTDHQVGRLYDALEDLGVADNTLFIYITGDNGASGEGTIHGAWSAPSFQNGIEEDPEWLLEHMEDFGTARAENHYNVGWAWALDAPFQWMKQVASHFGGTRNAMALSWPQGVERPGSLRSQFHHVIDVAPTILRAVGIPFPDVVNGITQMPVDGVAMNYCFNDPDAPSARTTQYFEMLGNRAIYDDGWVAACFHGRVPWERFTSREFDGPDETWELYDIRDDFSQAVNVADVYPEVLQELRALFDAEATRNSVFPLRDPLSGALTGVAMPTNLGARRIMTYNKAHVRLPERVVVDVRNSSFRISADVTTSESAFSGVLACLGGALNGWTLYLDTNARAVFHYNFIGHEHSIVRSAHPLSTGRHLIVVDFASDGGLGAGGDAVLFVDEEPVGHVRVPRTVPFVFSVSGETFDVGRDTGSPVGDYHDEFPFDGAITGVTIERLSEPSPEVRRAMDEGTWRAAMSAQ